MTEVLQRKYRKYELKRRYGITPEEYEELLEAQGGKCGLCETEQCSTGKRFAVDHDHDTGAVRGLLCYRCNTLVGVVEKDPSLLDKLVAWLRKGMA